MNDFKIVDRISLLIAAVTFFFSFFIFFSDTKIFFGSLAAALMTAGLVWATYVVLRWLLLANRS